VRRRGAEVDGGFRVAISVLLGVTLASSIMLGLISISTKPQMEQEAQGGGPPRESPLAVNVTPSQKQAGRGVESIGVKVEPSIFIDQAKIGIPFTVALAAGLVAFALVGRRISR